MNDIISKASIELIKDSLTVERPKAVVLKSADEKIVKTVDIDEYESKNLMIQESSKIVSFGAAIIALIFGAIISGVEKSRLEQHRENRISKEKEEILKKTAWAAENEEIEG